MMKVLVIAPHPDDEVLGVGGTIAKHTNQGDEVVVTIVSEGVSAQYTDSKMKNVRRKACKNACQLLGVETINFYDLPDAKLMDVGIVEITKVLGESIGANSPDIVYAPHNSELHMDHRMVYEATLVVTRPYLNSFSKKSVYFYETSTMKSSSFNPNYYIDISDSIDMKIDAFGKSRHSGENRSLRICSDPILKEIQQTENPIQYQYLLRIIHPLCEFSHSHSVAPLLLVVDLY